jgi:hypothetical protein
MNTIVLLYFAGLTFSNILLGWLYGRARDKSLRMFGHGLLFLAVAFAIWSAAVIIRPQNLESWVTVGVVFLLVMLWFSISAAAYKLKPGSRALVQTLGLCLLVGLFILRTFVLKSKPYFSSGGLFFFNPEPAVRAMYDFGMAAAVLPAVTAAGKAIKSSVYHSLFMAGWSAIVIGGVIQVSSNDIKLLYIDGWVMGLVYLALWTSFLLNRRAALGKA